MDAFVFEVSTEVAHKVGGIYAVLTSKSAQMKKNFKEYYTVGLYDPKTAAVDFEPVLKHPFHNAFMKLAEQGIKCYFGRWVGANKADCILIDASGLKPKTNEIKTALWDDYRIDSLYSSQFFNDMVVWGKAAGMVLEEILKLDKFGRKPIICQFHEWLTGAGLLHLHKAGTRAGLVFTTHATTMGRTMAEHGEDLVSEITHGLQHGKTLDDARAKAYNIEYIHTLEKACAHKADAFTTVSKVTADEAKYLLGKYPDSMTLNGLAIQNYPSMEELSNMHAENKQRVKHFVLSFFSPYYYLHTEDCLYFFTAGRYEYHNKGFDLLIDSLAQLNEKLKKENSKKTVVIFLWIPAATKGGDVEVMDNIALFEAMEEETMGNLDEIREHIIDSVCNGQLPTKAKVFDEPFLYDLKQMIVKLRSKRGTNPPICAMELADQNDLILRVLKEKGLDNSEDDRVKVIYYPTYLSSVDGLLGLNYNQAITGCHLGVFPSYYEPWGYTPLEAAALGVPSVTTDLAGFGRFMKERDGGEHSAIRVLERHAKGDNVATQQLTDYMHYLLNTNRKERVAKKIEAKRLSELADWQKLIKNYLLAYEIAIKVAQKRRPLTIK